LPSVEPLSCSLFKLIREDCQLDGLPAEIPGIINGIEIIREPMEVIYTNAQRRENGGDLLVGQADLLGGHVNGLPEWRSPGRHRWTMLSGGLVVGVRSSSEAFGGAGETRWPAGSAP
jgi:hypothetical protein